MIEEEEFESQLYCVYKSGNLQNKTNCKYIEFINRGNDKSIKHVLKSQFIISSNVTINNPVYNNNNNNNNLESTDSILVEILVRYETVFKEPQLCFRLWEQGDDVDASESLRLNYKLIDKLKENSKLPGWFILNIDLIDNEPWFIVGVCDTENIVGDNLIKCKSHYMERWVSVYLISWLT